MKVIGRLYFAVCASVALALAACSASEPTRPIFHAEANPAVLSDWNIIDVGGSQLRLAEGVLPYDLNTPLFSDYAHKLRTVWLPEGTSADYRADETFDFPVGTIISKTFYYPRALASGAQNNDVAQSADETARLLREGFDLTTVRLVETRLLVRRDSGWAALPYVWNDDQSEAVLKRIGDIKSLKLHSANNSVEKFSYVVPNVNQCAGCHATNATTRELVPIGPKARHLNKDYDYGVGVKHQLQAWSDHGALSGLPSLNTAPKAVNWLDEGASLDGRARAYLDINCSHCHNAVGPADTSGLMLEPTSLGGVHMGGVHMGGVHMGVCKSPIAAGTGTGGHQFGIVPGKPEESIMSFRIATTEPASMMPELGRTLAHKEGSALIDAWISQMEGECN